MYQQMDIFDFIEKQEEQSIDILRQLLYKVNNPGVLCVNCVCQYCVNNWWRYNDKVRPDEVIELCFDCDDCHEFTGDCRDRRRCKEHCDRFVLSDYGAARNRKHIKLVSD